MDAATVAVLESMQGLLKAQSAALCESAEAQTETANAMIQIAELLGDVSANQAGMHKAISDLTERLNTYLDSESRRTGSLRKDVSEIREKLGMRSAER